MGCDSGILDSRRVFGMGPAAPSWDANHISNHDDWRHFEQEWRCYNVGVSGLELIHGAFDSLDAPRHGMEEIELRAAPKKKDKSKEKE